MHLFARREDGTFAAPRVLQTAGGEALRVGRASWPSACDWDRDGDLDLVLGNMFGKVFLSRNASGGKELALAPPVPLVVSGVELSLDTTNAAPCVADWDQDGSADLLLGCGDGSVLFFRNQKDAGEPELAPPVELLEKSRGPLAGSKLEGHGLRARIAVFDWNEDGRLDLVSGEYCAESGQAPVLSAEQKQELDTALAESAKVGEERGNLERAALARWLAERKLPPEQADEHYEDFLVEWSRSSELAPLAARQAELAAVLGRLNPALTERGRVWVHLRLAK